MSALNRRRKRLLYRANHRGIKEMDIILGDFARLRLATLSEAELDQFEALLEESDRELLAWFTGERVVPARFNNPLIDAIFAHCNGARR
ncbi:MAG: hypothetical protein BroJett030_02790 [Alphaproteobacteria bacterium]|nr:MAG: hypothetical protein BroJett030_02790 [Alphaproteobacteria bacterium]